MYTRMTGAVITGALSLFPAAGNLACLTAAYLYTLVILQAARRLCTPPRRICAGSQLLCPRHYSRAKRDLKFRRLLPILP
jgi:hypothetical protein